MILTALLAESPSPGPQEGELQPWEVSPGILGFIFGFFLLAVAAIPLFRSMAKHMRRVEHNAELRRREEEAAAPQAEHDPASSDDAGPSDDGADRSDGGPPREQAGSPS
ncbi:hypothetical protein [Georgenia alba]|uniref:Uncharacterized protein n=1 Tax=Georgenia alba TaxID=2233858 RepID=A0ABW2Q718_9MICO